MSPSSFREMNWDNPEPGVYEAFTQRTTDVVLEVFSPLEDDEDDQEYLWWAVSEGRVLHCGIADSVEEAQRDCELAVAA